jgi:hypothetical protein
MNAQIILVRLLISVAVLFLLTLEYKLLFLSPESPLLAQRLPLSANSLALPSAVVTYPTKCKQLLADIVEAPSAMNSTVHGPSNGSFTGMDAGSDLPPLLLPRKFSRHSHGFSASLSSSLLQLDPLKSSLA